MVKSRGSPAVQIGNIGAYKCGGRVAPESFVTTPNKPDNRQMRYMNTKKLVGIFIWKSSVDSQKNDAMLHLEICCVTVIQACQSTDVNQHNNPLLNKTQVKVWSLSEDKLSICVCSSLGGPSPSGKGAYLSMRKYMSAYALWVLSVKLGLSR